MTDPNPNRLSRRMTSRTGVAVGIGIIALIIGLIAWWPNGESSGMGWAWATLLAVGLLVLAVIGGVSVMRNGFRR